MRRLLTLAIAFSCFVPMNASAAPNAAPSAQATTDISIISADIRTGQQLVGACYIILDWSEEGCDENGDGQVEFADVAVGTYTVTQTQAPPGYLAPGDFPIDVLDSGTGVFAAFLIPNTGGNTTIDIAIAPFDVFTNDEIPGACFLLNGGSLEGCDENGDNQVDFADVRAGTYLVTETQAPDGYGPPDPFWISVSDSSQKRIRIPQPLDNGLPNVAIVSIDDSTGDQVVGACYVIVDWSEEGCDENGDGLVTFAGVAPDTYTVTQTKSPAGYAVADDFPITVRNTANQSFPVRLDPNVSTRDVAIVSRDADTGNRLVGACYIIDGASIEGCDENNDGQVDFEDVFLGTFTIIETKAPNRYSKVLGAKITVTGSNDGSVQLFNVRHWKA